MKNNYCQCSTTVYFLNFETSSKFVVITLTKFNHKVVQPNNADRNTNSLKPDQTASLRAFRSGSALFALQQQCFEGFSEAIVYGGRL